jgi:hypothetical protein
LIPKLSGARGELPVSIAIVDRIAETQFLQDKRETKPLFLQLWSTKNRHTRSDVPRCNEIVFLPASRSAFFVLAVKEMMHEIFLLKIAGRLTGFFPGYPSYLCRRSRYTIFRSSL